MSFKSAILRMLPINITKAEAKRFGFLSVILTFIVGTYWLLRPLKDAIFVSHVGAEYLPYAKIASVLFLVLIILLYSKLVDFCQPQQLFYVVTPCYGIFFLFLAYVLSRHLAVRSPTTLDTYELVGWATYLGVESFILLVYAIFWSFVASITDTESAKRGYAFIFAGAQIGTIIGPEFAKHATRLGLSLLVVIAACGIFMIPLLIKVFTYLYPQIVASTFQDKKSSTGFIEGLWLLCSRPYLIGVLGVATLGSVVATILEFEFVYRAKEVYQSVEKITEFLGIYGQTINAFTFLFALFGTSFIIRKCGLTISLVAYPIIVGVMVCCVWYSPTLWVLFAAMVTIKCLSYALNSPCKEIMYIPTSKDVKFKAKGWIDTIGYRCAESIGGAVGILFPAITSLVFFGSIISLGVVAVWITVALYVGKTNYHLVQENRIID